MRTLPIHLPMARTGWLAGVWRLVDPKIALASLVPFVAGVAIAFEQSVTIDWTVVVLAYATIFLVEVGKNAVNDLYDFRSGADSAVTPEERSPFSGGKRTIVDHLLSEDDLGVIAWVAFGLAGLVALEVATRTTPMLLLIGVAAAIISVAYVMPPVALSYHGLGELAVFAVYGPGIILGTILMLGGAIMRESVIASIAFGLLIANVLLVNEIPDERADRLAGKRNLVVRLGRPRAEALIALVFLNAIALPVFASTYVFTPIRLIAFLAAAPFAAAAIAMLQRQRSGPPIAAQALTLATYVVAGIAFAASLVIA